MTKYITLTTNTPIITSNPTRPSNLPTQHDTDTNEQPTLSPTNDYIQAATAPNTRRAYRRLSRILCRF